MSEQDARPQPVRIELATSELDGGRCRAWADPAQVIALVAVSFPQDAFSLQVEPAMQDLAQPFAGGDPEGAPETAEGGSLPGLPLSVRSLVGRMQGIHRELFRQNRSLPGADVRVEMTCAVAEEDKVYFVKGGPSWVCLLRDGKAHAAQAPQAETAEERPALGSGEKLKIEVTSLPVRAGDTVVLLTAESQVPADLRAVAGLFSQTQDLKRACDGLVNLLGLQSQSASAVALRFSHIGSREAGLENPLNELSAELGWRNPYESSPEIDALLDETFGGSPLAEPGPSVQDRASARPVQEDREVVDFDDEVFGEWFDPQAGHSDPEPRQQPESLWREPSLPAGAEPSEAVGGAPEALEPAGGEPPATPVECGLSSRAEPEARPVEEPDVPCQPEEPELVGAGLEPDDGEVPAGNSWHRFWSRLRGGRMLVLPLLIGLAGLMVLLAAIPRLGEGPRLRLFGASLWGHGAPATGGLDVSSDPPATRIFLDGRPAGEATPALLASIPAGTHKIGLDLGPCGVWETDVQVRPDETLRIAPRLTGSVEVTAADVSQGGHVWVDGGEKMPVPARLDSLPAGWNRIFYEDSRVTLWDRVVLVRPDRTARIVVPNRFSRDQGLIKVESLVYQDRRGLLDSEGDTVWVDGRVAGLTPFESTVAPGLHSVRVSGHECAACSEVLDLKPGVARHVLAQLHPGPAPVFHHVAPGRVLARGPLLLSVEITGVDPSPELRPTLHLPELTPGVREVPLSLVDPEKSVYVASVDSENLPMSRPVSYYFTVTGRDGETMASDLYRLIPQRRWNSPGPNSQATSPAPNEPPAPPSVSPETAPASQQSPTPPSLRTGSPSDAAPGPAPSGTGKGAEPPAQGY